MVERGGLENRCTLAGTKGSNPLLSAKQNPGRKVGISVFRDVKSSAFDVPENRNPVSEANEGFCFSYPLLGINAVNPPLSAKS